MEAGADMVKIFPAALGGPAYMTNLKMVYPEVNLIPSGGISLENAGQFIRCGACAISGARNFFDAAQVRRHGLDWIREQTARYVAIVAAARRDLPPLP
jgi:2-dehydro-3-deoxyphosphogluconate aldolase/(4S)-4-hydroxy-2-oxoglutarate aldolase